MDLSSLFVLQQKEIELLSLQKRINSIKSNELSARLKQEYKLLKEEYLSLNGDLKKEKETKEMLRKNMKQSETNKSTYEQLKYSPEINNAKKLKLIEKQIIEADNYIKQELKKVAVIDKRMTEIEELVTEVKKKIFFIKNKLEKTDNENNKELQVLEEDEKRVQKEVNKIKSEIDESSLSEYSKLKSRFDDPISIIKSRKCTGCSVDVPSINYEAVRSGEILKCESCGRVLLFKKQSSI